VIGLAITITTPFGIIHIAKIYFSAHKKYQHIIFRKYCFKSLGYKARISCYSQTRIVMDADRNTHNKNNFDII